jgi:hypothetical protein
MNRQANEYKSYEELFVSCEAELCANHRTYLTFIYNSIEHKKLDRGSLKDAIIFVLHRHSNSLHIELEAIQRRFGKPYNEEDASKCIRDFEHRLVQFKNNFAADMKELISKNPGSLA